MRLGKRYWVFIVVGFCCNCTDQQVLSERLISEEFACSNDQTCFAIIDQFMEQGIEESVSWSVLPKADSLIYFAEYAALKEYATILVLENIEVDSEQEQLIRLGSDDGVRIFLNGEEVFRRAIYRGINADSDWIPISLKKGNNQLIIQVNQGTQNWALHYHIDEYESITNLFVEKAFDLYRDLPESCIISQNNSYLPIKVDSRTSLDSFNTITFHWKTSKGKPVSSYSYLGKELPWQIPMPEFDSFMIFEYEVKNGAETIYTEQIPIFRQDYVNTIAFDLQKDLQMNPIWGEGLNAIFAQKYYDNESRYYSSRMKTEFLWDILNERTPFEYQIAGPRTEIFNGELARRYVPQRPSGRTLIGMNLDFWDAVQQYLDSQMAYSHALMTEWNSYAQYHGVEILVPFTSNEIKELSTTKVLDAYARAHPDSFSVAVWSKSTGTIAQALGKESYPIKDVIVISPWVVDASTENFATLNQVYQKNPQVHWSIYRGDNDLEVSEVVVKEWMEMIEQAGMTFTFQPIPFTGHWVHWIEPLELYLN